MCVQAPRVCSAVLMLCPQWSIFKQLAVCVTGTGAAGTWLLPRLSSRQVPSGLLVRLTQPEKSSFLRQVVGGVWSNSAANLGRLYNEQVVGWRLSPLEQGTSRYHPRVIKLVGGTFPIEIRISNQNPSGNLARCIWTLEFGSKYDVDSAELSSHLLQTGCHFV